MMEFPFQQPSSQWKSSEEAPSEETSQDTPLRTSQEISGHTSQDLSSLLTSFQEIISPGTSHETSSLLASATSQETHQKTSQQGSQETLSLWTSSQDPSQQTSNETSSLLTSSTSHKATQEISQDTPQQTSQETPQQTSQETSQQTSQNASQQIFQESSSLLTSFQEIPSQDSSQQTSSTSQETSHKAIQETSQKASQDTPQQSSQEKPQQTSQETPQQTSQETPQLASQQTSQETSPHKKPPVQKCTKETQTPSEWTFPEQTSSEQNEPLYYHPLYHQPFFRQHCLPQPPPKRIYIRKKKRPKSRRAVMKRVVALRKQKALELSDPLALPSTTDQDPSTSFQDDQNGYLSEDNCVQFENGYFLNNNEDETGFIEPSLVKAIDNFILMQNSDYKFSQYLFHEMKYLSSAYIKRKLQILVQKELLRALEQDNSLLPKKKKKYVSSRRVTNKIRFRNLWKKRIHLQNIYGEFGLPSTSTQVTTNVAQVRSPEPSTSLRNGHRDENRLNSENDNVNNNQIDVYDASSFETAMNNFIQMQDSDYQFAQFFFHEIRFLSSSSIKRKLYLTIQKELLLALNHDNQIKDCVMAV